MVNYFDHWLSCEFHHLSDDVVLLDNDAKKYSNKQEVIEYILSINRSLSDLSVMTKKIYQSTTDYISLGWRVSGIHSGVFKGLLPTNRRITFSGVAHMLIQDAMIKSIDLFYNEKEIEDQICPPHQYSMDKKNSYNNFNGEGGKIYELILSSRSSFTDSKHALVYALRKDALRAPDFSLLNLQEINDIKSQSDFISQSIVIKKTKRIDLNIYTPKDKHNDQTLPTLLYLHGGGWCVGSPEAYDRVCRKLAISCQARVICPRYRLAPEHPYPAGFDDCCDVYEYLRSGYFIEGVSYNNQTISVSGDSAGGTFAAALPLRMKDEGKVLPNAIVLFSPATDMRLENYHSYNHYTKNNIMIDQGLIGAIRGIYASGDLWDHPYISPIRGDLSCFPKTFIMIGEEDPLYDENIAFSRKVSRESGRQVRVIIGKDMPHHYHTFLGMSNEIDIVYQELAEFLK